MIDRTIAAQKALSAVYRTGESYGVGYLVNVLLGASDPRIERNGHDRLSVYGIGGELSAQTWRRLFRQLIINGQLTVDYEGHGNLVLTEKARPLLRGEEKFLVRQTTRDVKARVKRQRRRELTLSEADELLYRELKSLRSRLAAEAQVPPYVICHDRTLAELAEKRPTSIDELHGISGLGQAKIERYGAALLEVVARPARDAAE